ncbi:hypothetical protein SAMN04488019_11531 [Phaeobacter italicus]|uniref:Uncharacterized protein n=1 Tax=Phaeobacter italicus TaxID=481446 RepID=A0A0H5CZ10_9RHOB|nr:hypothetical protein NIT7321_00902 [Phaeobacter italicus]SFH48153.1 hypothetical protein SAMN04488019_11531 [Phaeobacter italicus]
MALFAAFQCRLFALAQIRGKGAAGVELAPAWAICGRGDLSLQALRLAAIIWIQRRDRREKNLGIWMARGGEQLPGQFSVTINRRAPDCLGRHRLDRCRCDLQHTRQGSRTDQAEPQSGDLPLPQPASKSFEKKGSGHKFDPTLVRAGWRPVSRHRSRRQQNDPPHSTGRFAPVMCGSLTVIRSMFEA